MNLLVITDDMVYVPDTRELAQSRSLMKKWKKRWPNVMPWEIDTRDFSLRMSVKALDAWQRVRYDFGKAMYITCACRNWPHNEAVGGKRNSDHLTEGPRGGERLCTAFDVGIANVAEGRLLEKLAIKHGFNAIGRYPVSRFIHFSMRKPKPSGAIYQWGTWSKPKKVRHV